MFSSRPYSRPHPRGGIRAARLAGLAALALSAAPLAACSGDTVRALATDAGYGPKTVPAPDFVVASRAGERPDFMAVGVDAPRRAVRAKSSEGQKALEAELEGARGRNEARGRAAESAGRGAGKGIEKGTGKGTNTGTAGAVEPPPAPQ